MVDNQILVNGVMKDTKIGFIFFEVEEKNLARKDTTLTFPLKELLKFLDARF